MAGPLDRSKHQTLQLLRLPNASSGNGKDQGREACKCSQTWTDAIKADHTILLVRCTATRRQQSFRLGGQSKACAAKVRLWRHVRRSELTAVYACCSPADRSERLHPIGSPAQPRHAAIASLRPPGQPVSTVSNMPAPVDPPAPLASHIAAAPAPQRRLRHPGAGSNSNGGPCRAGAPSA